MIYMHNLKKRLNRRLRKILPPNVSYRIQKAKFEHIARFRRSRSSNSNILTFSVVVIALETCKADLDCCISSILAQTIDASCLDIFILNDKDARVPNNPDETNDNRVCRVKTTRESLVRDIATIAQQCSSDYIAFIDGKDFICRAYFESIEQALSCREDASSCLITYRTYFEHDRKNISDSHFLKKCFSSNVAEIEVSSCNYPLASLTGTLLSTSLFRNLGIMPNHTISNLWGVDSLILQYLSSSSSETVLFLRSPKYYIRTTKETSPFNDRRDLDLLFYSACSHYLDTAFGDRRIAPKALQLSVLFHLSNLFKKHLGHPEESTCMSTSNQDRVRKAVRSIFNHIDSKTIESAGKSWLGQELTAAFLVHYKNSTQTKRFIDVIKVDEKRRRIMLQYNGKSILFSAINGSISVSIDKRVDLYFFGKPAFEKHVVWIDCFPDRKSAFSLECPQEDTICFTIRNKTFTNTLPIDDAIAEFCKGWNKYWQFGSKPWIIMDRDTQADDNGEHFYRYMKNNHPEQACYFAIRRSSCDWRRLKREGFRLLDFGSLKHAFILRHCSLIASSHADKYVHSYFGDNFLFSKRFVFLQHGVIKDDLSAWLNNKPIDLFITSTPEEYHSIVAQGSPYLFTEGEVKLTGMPRHDSLISNAPTPGKTIVIAPTWRKSIMGKQLGKGNERALNPNFIHSAFYKQWISVLNSDFLKDLALLDYTIVFFPHANIEPYVRCGMLKVPPHITHLHNDGQLSIQDILKESGLLITDYSSLAFEMAYLCKPCIYFQFDSDSFFSGEHVYRSGYFDYETDGFGPVAYDIDALTTAIAHYVENDLSPDEPYLTRAKCTFPYKDKNCCDRVYKAIRQLEF